MVASAKPKAIGSPASTPAPSSSTKNTSRFQAPIACSAGPASQSSPATAASTAAPASRSRARCRASCSTALSPISSSPAGIADARTRPDQPSAGVSMNDWSSA